MTRDDHIKIIREACIKTNPEIESCVYCANGLAHDIKTHESPPIRVNARTIRLSDVLLAILKKADRLNTDRLDMISAMLQWELRKDDLNEQPDETLSFISGLLKENI